MYEIWKAHRQLILALISGGIVAVAWGFDAYGSKEIAVVLFIGAYFIGGYYKAKEGLEEFKEEKKLSVEVLMILAALGAGMIGYWMEGAILIFIFALSGALETYTMNKSEQEISKLMELQPEEATVIREGRESVIPLSEVMIGDHVRVRAGERIPADGVIIHGETTVDESAITGESIPIEKSINQNVLSGTVNSTSTITMKVTKNNEETLFNKIIEMVQSAKEEKSPSQQTIERFEGPYVKTVLVVVAMLMIIPQYLLGWSFEESFYRAMVLLVVASPCALVASVMPATLAAISNGARQGILFKGGVHLEQLGTVQAVGFDKTGTITSGTPIVTSVVFGQVEDIATFLATVAAIEKHSQHPLANAITSYCEEQASVKRIDVEKVHTHSGWGMSAKVKEQDWKVGKRGFFPEEIVQAFEYDKELDMLAKGKTVVYVGNEAEVLAVFFLEDTIRKVAHEAMAELKRLGVQIWMLTGDNEYTAQSISKTINIDGYVANCLPEGKAREVKKLREEFGQVAMVGDGINDAPALATSTVGIAMGAGTDAAIETADVVLIKNNLAKIPKAISLSKKMNRIIKQNIIFSIIVIIFLIVGNFMQQVSLPLGVIGHEGSTILVILNGLRLLRG
ncbi:heavy metal translocating P-type ATPase [Bacillus sp. FJAT-45037]|uniref:heavy metal translocating P-type ATPase n=1 Tax=Bacillus sp. FJAT-45037 TaxID=2011007 RepID=UPI000C247417|nr:heavy metal translocating P-type ATPase [Bacillus sp. FJAT-45037]